MMHDMYKFTIILICSVAAVSTSPISEHIPERNCSSLDCSGLGFSKKPELLHKEGHSVLVHNMDCKCDVDIEATRKRDDYQYTPGIGAHKFHTRGTTFNKARKICYQEGGHLAIIDCEEEAKVLTDLAKRAGLVLRSTKGHQGQGWVGIHDLFAEGEWVTLFGSPLHEQGYNKWTNVGGGQPNNADGIEHCGSFLYGHEDTGLNDLACNITEPFFCELPEVHVV